MGTITRKFFKETSSIHVYGRGKHRRVRLFYDWKSSDHDNRAVGYKYMILGYGVTQAVILRDAYDMLIFDIWDALCWYDTKIAETDVDRFKVPISG